jgi:hypothetical protein
MIFEDVLTESDKLRAERTLGKLFRHDVSRWALAGGFVTELHIKKRVGLASIRTLHDIDFIVPSFDCIPTGLAEDFLFRHVHPNDPPGKTLLQGVDEETGVRIDVFRAYGSVMDRTLPIEEMSQSLRMISHEDLTARAARLCLDLHEHRPIAPKYARDFLRLLDLSTHEDVESAWQEHRQTHRPESFASVAAEIRRLVAVRPELLVDPIYSTDVHEICSRCVKTSAFPLADAQRILEILGYC